MATILSKYQPLVKSKARYNILCGGRSGGRSRTAISYLVGLSQQPEYFRGYLMREVQSDIRESLFRDCKDLIEEEGWEPYFTIQENNMSILNNQTGHTILSKGFKKSAGNQIARLKSIAGATHVVIEEADEINEEDFNKLDESLRTTKSDTLRIILLLNTTNPHHWIWKRFFRGADADGYPISINEPNVITIHATYHDNLRYTSQSTINLLEGYAESNPLRYKTVTQGKLIYSNDLQIFRNVQPIALNDLPVDLEWHHGLDFGFNDPAVLTRMAIHNEKLYADCLIYQQHLTNQQLAALIRQVGVTAANKIYADSSEPKSIQELKDEGLWVEGVKKSPGSVLSGIKTLKQYPIFLTQESKQAWEEVKFYTWKAARDGSATENPVDSCNHFWDSLRYAQQGVINQNRYSIQYESY